MAPIYDEAKELEKYVSFNRQAFTTPLERHAEGLGVVREKGRYSSNPELRASLLSEFESKVNDEVLELISDNLESFRDFQDRVSQRISDNFNTGIFRPNRCPAYNRIVKTPKAGQCLWCGFDWHNQI